MRGGIGISMFLWLTLRRKTLFWVFSSFCWQNSTEGDSVFGTTFSTQQNFHFKSSTLNPLFNWNFLLVCVSFLLWSLYQGMNSLSKDSFSTVFPFWLTIEAAKMRIKEQSVIELSFHLFLLLLESCPLLRRRTVYCFRHQLPSRDPPCFWCSCVSWFSYCDS